MLIMLYKNNIKLNMCIYDNSVWLALDTKGAMLV